MPVNVQLSLAGRGSRRRALRVGGGEEEQTETFAWHVQQILELATAAAMERSMTSNGNGN